MYNKKTKKEENIFYICIYNIFFFSARILQHPRKQIPLFFVREKQTENCGTLYTEGAPDETRATFALTPSTRAPRQLNPVYQF
ncbi:hypothetical protein ANTPLA_LOCUS1498 [Anthophora plagiata]